MKNNAILSSMALMASTALAGAPGSANIVNKCDYSVHLSNVPAAGGGYSSIDQMLSPGGSYSQQYTQLSNGMGWSIKLSRNGNFGSNLMQAEYTYHDDGTIWYDLSEVDGNPWDGNWEITASSGCTPRQAAYRYSTDDAYGMQSCPDSSSFTIHLCSGTGHGGSPAASVGSGTEIVASTPTADASPATNNNGHRHHHGGHHHKHHGSGSGTGWVLGPNNAVVSIANKAVETPAGDVVANANGGKNIFSKAAPTPEAASEAPQPSDAPVASDNYDGPAVTVTNLAYETVTEMVTATASPHHHRRRHAHRA